MKFNYKNLTFEVAGGKIILTQMGEFKNLSNYGFAEVHIAGENKATHEGAKMIHSSEGAKLQYISHAVGDNMLSVVQRSELVEVTTFFEGFDDTNALRIHTEVSNISHENIVLEDVSAVVLGGLSARGIAGFDRLYHTKFVQSHHAECQPRRRSFAELGFSADPAQRPSQKRVAFANVGSWSTKEELPQGIVEDETTGQMLMFQIECASSWYYEMSDRDSDVYLYLGGANSSFGSWSKSLAPGGSYATPCAAVAFGTDVNELLAEITRYRRRISGFGGADSALPSIFNEYMHLSWDSPAEDTTQIYAPVAAKSGAEYYVIDCGWHNEEAGNVIYHYVGQWIESKTRFPHGLRATTDYIRSLGMKAGLWIEPEIVGVKCEEMMRFYDDDCFFQRYGKKVAVHDRYFLDYRNPKVISYMTETIRRMVEDYGADYIKFDYNQDCGIGTDLNCTSPGEGLEQCTNAFFCWIRDMKRRFPNVIFEGCASGGMRMDYKSLSVFSLMSTSDQTDYLKYPCIAANVLSAVVPEQAAVWSYPVGSCKKEEINDRQIVMNMINSFLGRLHLASHLDMMTDSQLQLVSEGTAVYKDLSEVKRRAVPYLPLGFTRFGARIAAAGLKDENRVWLAVWNLADDNHAVIPFGGEIKDARIVYPNKSDAFVTIDGSSLEVTFEHAETAVFMMIDLAE